MPYDLLIPANTFDVHAKNYDARFSDRQYNISEVFPVTGHWVLKINA